MANYDGLLPTQSEVIVDRSGIITRKFRDFLAQLATTTSDAALQAQITALDARVAALESGSGSLATLLGENGITVFGQITDPVVRIRLTAYLSDLLDVSEATPTEGDRLTWDAALRLWKPAPAPDGATPYFIPAGETFSVALNKQALFTMPIDVEGSLDVAGYLVEVD